MVRKRNSTNTTVNPALESLVQSWRQRNTVTDQRGTNMGLQGRVTAYSKDAFQNMLARTGFGTPNLAEGTDYPLVRFTFSYWSLIAMFEASWLTRKIVELPAQAMCKAWPMLTSDIDPKDITKIDRALRRTNARGKILTAITWARLFGGSGALIALKNQDSNLDEELDLDSVGIGDFAGLIPFDRWSGITPDGSVCTDMSKPTEFGLPEFYNVRATGGDSFKVHASRILRFTGPTVPTPEKEAYSAWGISVIEPVLDDIKKYDNIGFNILALSFRANILGMRIPDLASMLSGLSSNTAATEQFAQRMQQVNEQLSNQSLVLLPTDGELSSTSYSFSGLSEVFQQFQLAVSGAAGIPVTRLWGKTVTGLGNGTNEGDERVFEERIAQDQDEQLRPQLEKLYPVICSSELGEVPDDLDLSFPSIRVLDETEKSTLAKTVVDSVMVCLNGGIMSPRTAAKEIKQFSDRTGFGTNLTDEAIDKLPDTVEAEGEVGQGLFPEGGGLTPASGPGKVLKEENKAGKEHEEEPEPDDDDENGPVRPVKVTGEGNPKDGGTKALEGHQGAANGPQMRVTKPLKPNNAQALDSAPSDLKPGDRIAVNGALLTVSKVVTGTEDLFGKSTVQVTFTNGEIVPYYAAGDVRTEARDDFKEQEHPRRKDGKFGAKGGGEVRGHAESSPGSLKTVQQKAGFIQKELGVDQSTAQRYAQANTKYSGAGYSDVRSGKDHKTAQALEEYIDAAPKWDGNGPVYRGVGMSVADLESLVPGATVDMRGINSWSSGMGAGITYASRAPAKGSNRHVLFQMDKADSGTSIAHLSKFPSEKEVLISGKTRFEVVGVSRKRMPDEFNKKKTYVIHVAQVREVPA